MAESVKEISGVALIQAIDSKLEKVHTQALDLSFNELMDMADKKELDISPEYQRLFCWSQGAQSRFIESLLLEMPVPPIYVVEEDDGKYLLIDGLQRISSYMHLRGLLQADHMKISLGNKLLFVDCDIVEELNGKTYDDLPTALQIRLKRSFIRVEVVRKGSDARFKYHMFKRLNTGGQLLTDQQLRNCTVRMLDPQFNDFVIRLSGSEAFLSCTETLTRAQRMGAYDVELVLRFFALKNYRENFKHNVGDFLTEYMEAVSEGKLPFTYAKEEEVFEKTFRLLGTILGAYSFSYYNKKSPNIVGAFGAYQYEAFVIGVQPLLDRVDLTSPEEVNELKLLFENIKRSDAFMALTTGGGKNSPGQLKERIDFVIERISGYGKEN